MSLRWRIALGFALVALATAALIALATPPIIGQGFSELDNDRDGATAVTATATLATGSEDVGDNAAPVQAPPADTADQVQQSTILRLILVAQPEQIAQRDPPVLQPQERDRHRVRR